MASEVFDFILPGSKALLERCWCMDPLRYNVVDGEDYGRGRVEEFLETLSL